MMPDPKQIIEESESTVRIVWSDEREDVLTAAVLRRSCPCASCINEWTGEKMLRDESVADDMRFGSISLVGRYAVNFVFSDGHSTGLFTFTTLRSLGD
jgi:DUF971 family protein